MAIEKQKFVAKGTTCHSCAEVIRRQALKVDGVKAAKFDYSDESGEVTFDTDVTDIDTILDKIEEKGYTCFLLEEVSSVPSKRQSLLTPKSTRILGWAFGIIGVLIAGYFLFNLVEGINLPEISPEMSYGLLFLVGLLTGFHCIAMCGGFVISYTAKDAQAGRKSYKSHMMYAIGKTLSYTMIGAIFGLLGSIIAFTPMLRGLAGIIAGVFLIVFGIKMLNLIPALRKFNITTPRFITRFVGHERKNHSSPLVVGLLNGLMIACGPLQAIYVMAAGTGSMLEGAKLLFVFGLGTLPVMMGFGLLSSFISSKMTHKILKVSGAFVMVLGLLMVNNGLALTGTGYDINSVVTGLRASSFSPQAGGDEAPGDDTAPVIKDGYQEIRMDVTRYGWEPNTFVLKKGVPVKWIINGKEINGCNKAIISQKLGLQFDIKPGEQVIEFTPKEEGTIPFSCWMGMIRGTFIVKDDIDLSDKTQVQDAIASAPPTPKGSSCGMGAGGGGCGCGGGAI